MYVLALRLKYLERKEHLQNKIKDDESIRTKNSIMHFSNKN